MCHHGAVVPRAAAVDDRSRIAFQTSSRRGYGRSAIRRRLVDGTPRCHLFPLQVADRPETAFQGCRAAPIASDPRRTVKHARLLECQV